MDPRPSGVQGRPVIAVHINCAGWDGSARDVRTLCGPARIAIPRSSKCVEILDIRVWWHYFIGLLGWMCWCFLGRLWSLWNGVFFFFFFSFAKWSA